MYSWYVEEFKDPLADPYGLHTEHADHIRRRSAKNMLQRMDELEAEIVAREDENARIENESARLLAESELSLEYVHEFGVLDLHRHEFRRLLKRTVERGDMTLREIAVATERRFRDR